MIQVIPLEVLQFIFSYVRLTSDDVLVDLGSGDGRVCLYASKHYGCYAVGYEIDKAQYEKAVETQKWYGGNASFIYKDFKEADLSKYSVIFGYIHSYDGVDFSKVSKDTKIVTVATKPFGLKLLEQIDCLRHRFYLWSVE